MIVPIHQSPQAQPTNQSTVRVREILARRHCFETLLVNGSVPYIAKTPSYYTPWLLWPLILSL